MYKRIAKLLPAKENRPPEAPLEATFRPDSVGKFRKKL
jgi:hypothetical protein